MPYIDLCKDNVHACAPALVASLASSRDPLLDRSLIAPMQQFLDAAVDAGQWQRAVPAARWLVLCYSGCYGLVNPLVGLQLFSLVRLLRAPRYERLRQGGGVKRSEAASDATQRFWARQQAKIEWNAVLVQAAQASTQLAVYVQSSATGAWQWRRVLINGLLLR